MMGKAKPLAFPPPDDNDDEQPQQEEEEEFQVFDLEIDESESDSDEEPFGCMGWAALYLTRAEFE